MNILAHLHLASLAESSLLGNSIADFVKGDPYLKYSQDIADGIMMHRRLDKLIDSLPEAKQAKEFFIQEHQRIAFITLDIIWDHFLAKNWSKWQENITLAEFNLVSQRSIEPNLLTMPEEFQQFMTHLWRENWLENYIHLDYIHNVLQRMAKRRPKLSALADSFTDIEKNYTELESLFNQFYPFLMLQARSKAL